jgi:GT2 family glycosyltransferase
MQISVVTPVYNAEKYVRAAVESALAQPQTAEVILVEDASPDDSLAVCEALASEHPDRVRVLCHPDGANRGAGLSRELGIAAAKQPYVACLDADDYYLPGCFDRAEAVLQAKPDADGVYSAIGVHFETEAARESWFTQTSNTLTTVEERLPPERLFKALVMGGRGYFHLNALVARREVFKEVGGFDPLLHEDTAMSIKLAALSRLYPAQINEPVAMRRYHDANPSDAARRPRADVLHHHDLLWRTLVTWSLEYIDSARQALIFGRWLTVQRQIVEERDYGRVGRRLGLLWSLLSLGTNHPSLLGKRYYLRAVRNALTPGR